MYFSSIEDALLGILHSLASLTIGAISTSMTTEQSNVRSFIPGFRAKFPRISAEFVVLRKFVCRRCCSMCLGMCVGVGVGVLACVTSCGECEQVCDCYRGYAGLYIPTSHIQLPRPQHPTTTPPPHHLHPTTSTTPPLHIRQNNLQVYLPLEACYLTFTRFIRHIPYSLLSVA